MAKKKTTKKKTAKTKTAKKKFATDANSLERGKSTSGKKTSKKKSAKKNSLVANINRRKKAGKSRSKARSTISDESYEEMERGWPNSQRKKATKKSKRSK